MKGAANAFERRPLLVFAWLSATYLVLLVPLINRPLWHDELFTFYIANAPSFRAMLEQTRTIDLNPPLLYIVTRWANSLFGLSPAATRLPSTVAYYLATALLFFYLRRKVGALFGAAALLLFWSGVYFAYAAEARPYGILLFFFVLMLVSYDRATTEKRPAWTLAGLWLGGLGMVAMHVLAPFSIGPFYVAELLRSARRRRVDWAVAIALLAPLAAVAIYAPLVRRFDQVYFPPAFQASARNLARFYWVIFRVSVVSFLGALIGMLVGVWMSRDRKGAVSKVPPHWRLTDLAIGATLTLVPVLVTAVLMRSHGAFWDRYCITSALAIYIACVAVIAQAVRHKSTVALAMLIGISLALLVDRGAIPFKKALARPRSAAALERIEPELPIVAASGVTFLEMDHNEGEILKNRLYLLQDRASAIHYAHATLFEGFDKLKEFFPIQSHVESLESFKSEHAHFLVLTRAHYPEDWLLPKLADDGARIRYLGEYLIPYEDRRLYDVTLATR